MNEARESVSYIQFLGAAGTVTGSKHLINSNPPSASATSGFQTAGRLRTLPGTEGVAAQELAGPAGAGAAIHAVMLTHAHLDHCGWIPRLCRKAFRHDLRHSTDGRSVRHPPSRLRLSAGRRRGVTTTSRNSKTRPALPLLHLGAGAGSRWRSSARSSSAKPCSSALKSASASCARRTSSGRR